MDDETRRQIAMRLETLVELQAWDDDVWQSCYDLVKANMDDKLVSYVHDDLIHCSATPIQLFRFGHTRKHPLFGNYKQEFRDIAAALRAGLSLQQYRDKYE